MSDTEQIRLNVQKLGEMVKVTHEDRRTQRTRRCLVQALMTLMQEKRYDRITIQDIIDRADVGRSTFYAHYQDKEDLLVTSFGEMMDALGHHLALSPRQGASIIPCRELFQHVHEQEAVYKAIVWGRGVDILFQKSQVHLSQTLERRLAARLPGGYTPPVPLPIVAAYLSGALINLLRWWLDQRMPHSPEHMETIFEQMVMPGVWTALGVDPMNMSINAA